jgi:hypothetical protein
MSRCKCTVFIYSQGPYWVVNSDRVLATFLYTREILTVRTLASREFITLQFGGGGTRVYGFVTSLA